MLVVGIFCDHGVGRVLHESILEPLDELALETVNVSIVDLRREVPDEGNGYD